MLDHINSSPDVRDNKERTPLWRAVENGARMVASSLLSRQDVNVNLCISTQTLLDLSIENNDTEMVELLMEKGAKMGKGGPRTLGLAFARGNTNLA